MLKISWGWQPIEAFAWSMQGAKAMQFGQDPPVLRLGRFLEAFKCTKTYKNHPSGDPGAGYWWFLGFQKLPDDLWRFVQRFLGRRTATKGATQSTPSKDDALESAGKQEAWDFAA